MWSPDANQFAAVHAGEIFGEEARLALYDAELNLVTLTSVAPETHVIGFAEHGRRLVVGRSEVAELFSSDGGRLLTRVGEVGLPGWVEGADSWFDAEGMTFAYEAGGYLQWVDLAGLRLLERTNITALDIAVDPARGVVAGASTGQVWTNESRTLSAYAGIPWNPQSCISRGFNGGSRAWGSIRFEATDGHLVAAAPWHPRVWSENTARLDVESVALAFAPNAAVSQDARRPPYDEYLILELRAADSRADVCNGHWLREPPRAPVPLLPAMFLVAALFVCAPLCRRRR